MVVWALTAGIGVYLLAAVIAAHREQAAGRPAPGGSPAASGSPAPGGPAAARGSAPGESALLEFSHPALALTGLAIWIFFVVTSARVFAWAAFGVVVAAILAGLTWAVRGWRQARSASAGGETGVPVRLLLIHGFAAACTVTLVVIAAVTARA